jgi:hypothetical protein
MVRSLDAAAGRVPTFLRDRPVTRAAFAFAARAHRGDRRERKSALRGQVAGCDCEATKIYAADKLSKVRELRIRLRAEPAFAVQPERRSPASHDAPALTRGRVDIDGAGASPQPTAIASLPRW